MLQIKRILTKKLRCSNRSLQMTSNLNLLFYFASSAETVTLSQSLTYLRQLSSESRHFYSEVCIVAHLLLVMPATNAVSESSFSTMRRIKSYLWKLHASRQTEPFDVLES